MGLKKVKNVNFNFIKIGNSGNDLKIFISSTNNLYTLNLNDGAVESSFPIQYNLNDINASESIYGVRSRNWDGLIKYDLDGNTLWEYTGNSSFVYTVESYNSNVYIGEYDAIVTKVSEDGSLVWKDTRHNDSINSVIEANGNIYSASSDSSIRYRSEDNNYLGGRSLTGSVSLLNTDGNYIYAMSSVPSDSDVGSRIYKLSLDLDTQVWSKDFSLIVNEMTVDMDGNIYLLEKETSPTRMFLTKLNSDGIELNRTQIEGSIYNSAGIFIVDDNIYTSYENKLYKLNLDGTEVWSVTIPENASSMTISQ